MTKPLNTQLSQRESPQPRSARRPRTWLVALLGFGAADLLVLNLWAVPSLITNTTTTDMRAAQSGERQDAELQPQAAVVAQPDSQGADAPVHAAQATLGESPSQRPDTAAQLAAQGAQQHGAAQDDTAAQLAAPQENRAAQQGESPSHVAHRDDVPAPRGARVAHQADATSPRGTRQAQQVDTASAHQGARAARQADVAREEGAAPYPGDMAAQEGTPAAQREGAQGSGAARPGEQGPQQYGATTRRGDSAVLPREAATLQGAQASAAARPGEQAAQQNGPATRHGDAVARAELQRGAVDSAAQTTAARTSDSAQGAGAMRSGDVASPAAQQPGAARQGDSAAQAAPSGATNPSGDTAAPEGAQSAAEAQQAAAVGEPAAAARDDWAARAPRAEAPPGGAPPREVADVPADPAVARAFAVRAAQRAVRVALTDRNAFPDNGPFDALTVADQPLTQIFFSMGNFTLGPNGKQTLERKLPQLIGDQRPILIVGAADPSGPEQVNEKLSDARAQSVAEWLLAHGVDAQRIQTHAIGHEGAVGSTLDRRVDIWLGGSR